MTFNDEKLKKALEQGIITQDIYDKLIMFENDNKDFIDTEDSSKSKFFKINLESLLLYIASMIIFGGMSLLMWLIIDSTGYSTILITAIIYSAVFWFSGEYMWKNSNKIPAGIFYLFTILAFALCVTVITKMTGFYPKFSSGASFELQKPALTLISILSLVFSGVLMRIRSNFFSTIPLLIGTFFLCNIHCESIFRFTNGHTIALSIYFLIVIVFAFLFDRKTKVDHSFWLYLTGVSGLYCSVATLFGEIIKDNNIVFMVIMFVYSLFFFYSSLIFKRKIFLIIGMFGSLGFLVSIELWYLSEINASDYVIIAAMIMTGITILFCGLKYKKYMSSLEKFAVENLPAFIKNRIPKNED